MVLSIFIGCKNQEATPSAPNQVQTDSTNVTELDSVAAAKLARQKERDALAKPYNETEDAQAKINELLVQAKKEGKNVFIQAGGNWCIWCLRFNDFVQNNPKLKQMVDDNFLYYHLNFSKENKNDAVFNKYAPNGKEFGFPFFIVLDSNGKVLDVLSSDFVASEDGSDSYYNENNTIEMFSKYAKK